MPKINLLHYFLDLNQIILDFHATNLTCQTPEQTPGWPLTMWWTTRLSKKQNIAQSEF